LRSMHGIWTSPSTGSHVRPRWCSMPISAACSIWRGDPPRRKAHAAAAMEHAVPTCASTRRTEGEEKRVFGRTPTGTTTIGRAVQCSRQAAPTPYHQTTARNQVCRDSHGDRATPELWAREKGGKVKRGRGKERGSHSGLRSSPIKNFVSCVLPQAGNSGGRQAEIEGTVEEERRHEKMKSVGLLPFPPSLPPSLTIPHVPKNSRVLLAIMKGKRVRGAQRRRPQRTRTSAWQPHSAPEMDAFALTTLPMRPSTRQPRSGNHV